MKKSDKPIRIQRKRTKGWKMPLNTVYVGRGSKWGNPCKIYKDKMNSSLLPCGWRVYDEGQPLRFFEESSAIHQSVNLYKKWLKRKIKSGELDISELRGKNLACWCPILDKSGQYCKCHADVLLSIANNLTLIEVENENSTLSIL